jgi:hypothetical protein
MSSHQNPQSFSRKAGDCPAWRRLTKSQDQENIIINRPGRSTYPQEKSVLTSAATPHSMVGHRMRDWYKEGINPQSKLPYLATYLGHKDIRSTLVYLSITQELLHEANERFRRNGAATLRLGGDLL